MPKRSIRVEIEDLKARYGGQRPLVQDPEEPDSIAQYLADRAEADARYAALSTTEKIEHKRAELAGCDDEFAKRHIEFDLLKLEGASDDDLAIANFILWEFCRTSHDVERPSSVEDLPYSFWPDSRKDAAIAAAWEARHRDNWRSQREDAAEGEILPKAALPSPSRRLPGTPRVPSEPDTTNLHFEPHADDWIRGGNPEEIERARAIVSGGGEQ